MGKTSTKKTEAQDVAIVEEQPELKLEVGCMVKINPDAKHFVDGLGIQGNVLQSRKEKMYVASIDSRSGMVGISYMPNGPLVGVVMPSQITVVAPPKRNEHMMKSEYKFERIDVRIMGVPERIEHIKKMQEVLDIDDNHVFIDEDHLGCVANARRAWGYPTDKEYVMVLQDDVEFCNDFPLYCERIIKTHPDAIISLFPYQFRRLRNVHTINPFFKMKTPYITTKDLSGQGIIMKASYVKPCLDYWDDSINGDDVNINRWATKNNIRVLTTIPATLQHQDVVSAFNPERNVGSTTLFCDDVSDVDWETKEYELWSNVFRN